MELGMSEQKILDAIGNGKKTQEEIAKETGINSQAVRSFLVSLQRKHQVMPVTHEMRVYYLRPKAESRDKDVGKETTPETARTTPHKEYMAGGLSQKDRVVRELEQAGREGLSNEELVQKTGVKLDSVNAVLSILRRKGEIFTSGGKGNKVHVLLKFVLAPTQFDAPNQKKPEPETEAPKCNRVEASNVYSLPASVNFTPEQALKSALELVYQEQVNEIMVIGYCGEHLFVRSSKMARRDALWLIKAAELHTIEPMMVISDE